MMKLLKFIVLLIAIPIILILFMAVPLYAHGVGYFSPRVYHNNIARVNNYRPNYSHGYSHRPYYNNRCNYGYRYGVGDYIGLGLSYVPRVIYVERPVYVDRPVYVNPDYQDNSNRRLVVYGDN